jgi:hypothetical protein
MASSEHIMGAPGLDSETWETTHINGYSQVSSAAAEDLGAHGRLPVQNATSHAWLLLFS